MIRINNYNAKILEWAEEKFRMENIAEKFPKLKDWVNGDINPTIKQLADFSKATSIPFGFFFLDNLPELNTGVPLFRTNAPASTEDYSNELRDTIGIIQNRQEWLKEYLINEGYSPLDFVGSYGMQSDPKEVSQAIREELDLSENWAEKQSNWESALKFLFQKTEEAGIYVSINGVVGNNTHRALNPNEFRGFVLSDIYAPCIFINGKDFTAAKMFTLAHELAHIWLGKTAAFDLKYLMPSEQTVEVLCNKIAAEFLVPQNVLNEMWNEIKNSSNAIEATSIQFKVSQIVAARRLLDIGKINQNEFIQFYNNYKKNWNENQAKKTSGGDFYNNQNYRVGKTYFKQILTATKEGKLLYTDAYKLTGLFGKTFSQFEDKLIQKS